MTDSEILDQIAKSIRKHDDNADGDGRIACVVRRLMEQRGVARDPV